MFWLMTSRTALIAATLGLIILISAACAKPDAARPNDLPDGINDHFLSEDMDVDRYKDQFEGESRGVYAKRFEIVEALDLTPGDAVADIGAGTGFFSFLFAEVVGRTGQVFGVEISPGFIDHLRKEKILRGLGQFYVVEGTTASVELEEASTDLAFICDVYHHFETPEASLTSLHAAIRPGGSLVVIEFHRIEGVTNDFIYKHVRAPREVFQAEIEAAGFRLTDDIEIDGLDDNYILRFERLN